MDEKVKATAEIEAINKYLYKSDLPLKMCFREQDASQFMSWVFAKVWKYEWGRKFYFWWSDMMDYDKGYTPKEWKYEDHH